MLEVKGSLWRRVSPPNAAPEWQAMSFGWLSRVLVAAEHSRGLFEENVYGRKAKEKANIQ